MEREYEALINKRDTQLPDGVRDRLLAYAEKAGLTAAEGPEDWLRVARAAAQVVQNAGTYTEKPGAAPEGQDFVLYFLEESPRGYCIHFCKRSGGFDARAERPRALRRGLHGENQQFQGGWER